jgi:hypothetical protein
MILRKTVKHKEYAPIPKMLHEVILLFDNIHGIYRRSVRDVPHLVVEELWSVCYFGKNKFYRVFYPYGRNGCFYPYPQVKKNFQTAKEVAEYFNAGKHKELMDIYKEQENEKV